LASTIEVSEKALKQLAKLDKQTAKSITTFLRERIAPLDDPRSTGKALVGSTHGGFWRYRVGDYRIICEIQDGRLHIIVIKIGHRSDVYD